MHRRLLLYLTALGTVFLWGASFPLTKAALAWSGPTAIAFLRWAISSFVLAIWLARKGRLWPAEALLRAHGGRVLWVGFCGITLFYTLENLALRYTTAINAGVLANLTTVFMLLLGVLWLGERLRRVEWAAGCAALIGAVLVSQGAGHLTMARAGLAGDLLMAAATLFAAIYSVGSKRLLASHPADVVMTVVAMAGTAMLLPFALWEGLSLALPLPIWGVLLLLGVGSGALANLWWMQILAYTTASRAGMALLLIPLVSTTLAVLFLGERLSPIILAGGALVVAGVLVVQRHGEEVPQHDRNA